MTALASVTTDNNATTLTVSDWVSVEILHNENSSNYVIELFCVGILSRQHGLCINFKGTISDFTNSSSFELGSTLKFHSYNRRIEI